MQDILTEIWTTTKRNKLRTALTGFSVAWGIFILIFLLGAGNGLINAVSQSAGNFLSNSMMVGGWLTSKPYDGLKEGRRIRLNERDRQITETRFTDNVERVGASITQNRITLKYADNYKGSVSVVGTYPNLAVINKIRMLRGRFINDIDNREQRKTVVVCESDAKELLPQNHLSLVGKNINVGNASFQVVGIYEDDESSTSNDAYTAYNTLRTMYNRGDQADNVFFSFHGLESEEANERFEKSYRAALNLNHRAAPDDENAIWVWNRFTQNLQMAQGMDIIRTALWVIGIFTLLSGIVGVSNIMLITVKERTHEFGIRKAIGAKPWSILRLIIVESITITTLFGYIGMVLGMAANSYMDATIGNMQADTGLFKAATFVDPTVGIGVCVKATIVMIVAGTLAGLVPARRAARIRPIEALREE